MPFALAFAIFVLRSPRALIQAQYDRWSKAYMANDVDTLLDILAPEYTLTNIDKKTISYKTYAAYLKLRKDGPKDTTRYKTRIAKLAIKGDEADVDSMEVMTTEKPDPNTGLIQTLIHTHEYLDKWRLTNQRWLLFSTTTIKESTKISHKR